MIKIKNSMVVAIAFLLMGVSGLYAEQGESEIFFGCPSKNITDEYGKPNRIINNAEIKNGYVYTFREKNEKITEIYEFKNKKFFKFYAIRIFSAKSVMSYISDLKNDKNIEYVNKLFADDNNKVIFYMIEQKNIAYTITYNFVTNMVIEEKYPINNKYKKLFNRKKRQ